MKVKLFALVLIALSTSMIAVAQDSKMIDEVIIKINDEIITRSEFEKKIDTYKTQLATRFTAEQIESQLPAIKKNMFNIMVNQKIFDTVAQARGWEMPEEQYQTMVDYFKQQTKAKNDQEFLQALKDNGMTLEDMRAMAKRNFVDGQLFRFEVAKEIPDTESAIQEYYEENTNKYIVPAKIRISQIIFPSTEDTQEEVKKTADQALARIKSGEDFAEVYRSVTPQAAPDATGDIGEITLSSLRDEMRVAISVLNKGEVSEVIVTPNAMIIVKLTEKDEEKIIPLEEIKDRVVNDMREEIMQDGLDKLVLRYKKEMFIELKSDEFKTIYDPKSTRTR